MTTHTIQARPPMPGAGELTFATARRLRDKARLAGMNPNYWYPVAWREEVPAGAVKAVRFWGQPIALFRGEDGTVGAVEDRCAHRHIPLTMGHVRGCELVCLYHGWSYDRDGRLTGMKHDDFGKRLPKVALRRFPVRERYGIVWLFPGSPELAEAVGLPEIPFAEGPDRWASIHFDYTWRAHHSMVIDNLCNLTHLYVHGRWVPYDVTHLAHSALEDEKITLTWSHTLRKDALYPIYLAVFRKPGTGNVSETEMIYDYPYQSALSNRRVRSCNFMLPVDETTTRVFTVQLWKGPQLPMGATGRAADVMRRVVLPFVKPISKEIFRQDGATVEAEQEAMRDHFAKPVPEPNPSVKMFERLTVERWEAWEQAADKGDPGLAAPTSRAKVL